MSTKYTKKELRVNDNMVATVLQGTQGCANLVAIHNLVAIRYSSTVGKPGPWTESFIKSVLRDMLQLSIDEVVDMPDADAKEAKNALANIRTQFSLQPCLSAHLDFVQNGSTLLCQLLKLHLLHGWVLNPEDSSYDFLRDFSHSQLVDHYTEGKGDHVEACKRLLDDSSSQLTSYGFRSLSEELSDDGAALLFCRNRLDVIHKHNGALFIYVADQAIFQQMPQAVWMLFEERQEKNIYFTDQYSPVKGQPHEDKAREWFREFLVNQRKGNEPKEDKGKEKNKSSQQRQSDDAAPESSEPSEATGKHGEDKSSDKMSSDDKRAEAVGSHHSDGGEVAVSHQDSKVKKSPQQAQSVDGAAESSESSATTGIFDGAAESSESSATTGILTTGNEAEVKSDKPTPEDDQRAEAVGSHHSNISVSQDGVPKGDASDFLNFLNEFKDNGCSAHYFEGTVAAFASQKPLFYVPYDFIMAFNEPLALKIQDNYSGIYEDLRKAVVFYLSKKGVQSPDAVLKILGRPEAKSVQRFLDFVDTIVLHEHYAVYGEHPKALPSYDSRRMGLGYLGCIVAKFKTGRCWAGKWSEANMKVKNGSKFVIDLEEDCQLDADGGFLDLNRFCETVLNRLKIDGKFLPYFDALAEDHLLINDCFGKPEKWQRFLELISYPLALKPPLVRAAFICNVYIVGDANSSGNPPTYSPLSSRRNCVDWRREALKHPLLMKVYDHQNDRKIRKYKYLIDNWSAKHWHVFKFCRHFIQHALGYTKGDDLIQKIKDISEVDILLSRTIWKAIAASFRFLVLNCGVDGLFSSAWRHYVGSDYVDKPNLEDTTTGDMVQGFLDSISEPNISGYVYCEISLYSEPQHVSIIFSDAQLIQLQKFLNGINFRCVHNGAYLQCGSVKLWKHIYTATEESAERGVIVVEGPYSAEYDSVYEVLTEFLDLPPTL